MASEGEEEWNGIKVLLGNGKFREYRLPKALSTNRSTLWRSKYEVGKRIAQIMKTNKSHIMDLKRCIKRIEQSQSGWIQLAKTVNEENENFFLDAVSGSEEDIEKFEKENFLSNYDWTRHRNVEDLSTKEMKELISGDLNDCTYDASVAEDKELLEETEKHYDWILQNTENDGRTSREPCCSESHSHPKAAKVCEEIKRAQQVNAANNQSSSTSSVVKQHISQTVMPGNVISSDVQTASEVVGKDNNDLKKHTAVEAESEVARPDSIETASESQTKEVTEQEVDTESLTTTMEDISSPITDELSELSSVSESQFQMNSNDVSSSSTIISSQQNSQDNEEHTSPTSSTVQQTPMIDEVSKRDDENVKQAMSLPDRSTASEQALLDDSGISSLGMNTNEETQELVASANESDNDETGDVRPTISTSVLPTTNVPEGLPTPTKQVHIPKKSDGVESNDVKPATSNPETSSVPKKQLVVDGGISKLRLTPAGSTPEPPQPPAPKVRHGTIWEQKAAEREEKLSEEKKMKDNQFPALVAASTLQPSFINNNKNNTVVKNYREPQKKVSTSKGWPKLGDKNSRSQETNSWITFSAKKAVRPTQNKPLLKDLEKKESLSSNASSSSVIEKPSNKTERCPESVSQETTAKAEEDPVIKNEEPQIDEAKAAKRAKRRQRVQEKAKLKKEEEKRLKEQKRTEFELKVKTEKQEKEAKSRQEYERKQKEIEEIRRTREKENPTKAGKEAERIKEMLSSKDRLHEHIKEKNVIYRSIGSKLYMDQRIPEIAKDQTLEINRTKFNVLKHFRSRIDDVDHMNRFLVFASIFLKENEDNFTMAELIKYFPKNHRRSDVESPRGQIVVRAFNYFCDNTTLKETEIMTQAVKFADIILSKGDELEYVDAKSERTLSVLRNYKHLYEEAVNFMGITSYLRTRIDNEFFIVEEDYLLTVSESENSGYLGEVKSENESEDDDEFVNVQDMSCQTEGDPYDVRAASYLPTNI